MNREIIKQEIEDLISEDSKLDFVKKVQELGMNENDEALVLLYAYTHLKILYEDLPQSVQALATSVDKIGVDFESTLLNQGNKFAEAVHGLVKKEIELMDVEREKFVSFMGSFIDELTRQMDQDKARALSEIAAREAEFKRTVDEVKKKTTQTFVEAVRKEVDTQTGFTWKKFGMSTGSVLVGLTLFNILKALF